MSYRERIYVDCLTVKNYWGLLTGDDGVDGGDFTWRVVNMDLILEVQTNIPSTLTDCFTSPCLLQ